MAWVAQLSGQKWDSKRAEDTARTIQLPDLQQVTVLNKAQWQRIQDKVNRVDKDKEVMRETVRQREALQLKSKEVVKQWPNTIASQRQKKLEAKKIREENEEEKKRQIDEEEAKYQEQKQQEAVAKAKAELFYQTNRVRSLHSALLLTEVLNERDAQIKLKQRLKSARKDTEKDFREKMKTREDEALRQEQEKACQKKLSALAFAEDMRYQIKEKELLREIEKMEIKKEGEETQRSTELHQREQRMQEEEQKRKKRDLMHANLEYRAKRDLIRTLDVQKQQAEEAQRELFLSAKQKMMKLRKDREAELFREAQERRDRIMDKLTVTYQEQSSNEEQRMAKAITEQDAKLAQKQREEQEKRAGMLKSISAHRELMLQEKEQKKKTVQQNEREALQAKREADRIFTKDQQIKSQLSKEESRKILEWNSQLIAEKRAQQEHLRRQEHDLEDKNKQLLAEEDEQFQRYSQQVIEAAAEVQRNVFPLRKAGSDGSSGFGPVSCGARPIYLVQDRTGAHMPKYVSGVTQNVKKLNEAGNIEEGKRRLGFS
ncbi:uncharacterized protein V6R79_024665 [Siganus canaliculatus]